MTFPCVPLCRSSLVFAHVRAASLGSSVTEANCHPFAFSRYLFMHNGGRTHTHCCLGGVASVHPRKPACIWGCLCGSLCVIVCVYRLFVCVCACVFCLCLCVCLFVSVSMRVPLCECVRPRVPGWVPKGPPANAQLHESARVRLHSRHHRLRTHVRTHTHTHTHSLTLAILPLLDACADSVCSSRWWVPNPHSETFSHQMPSG